MTWLLPYQNDLETLKTMDKRVRELRRKIGELEEEFEYDAAIAHHLEIHQAHIHNYFSGKRNISPTLKRAIYKKYPDMKPKRIRSQITWESEEQKAAFLRYIGDRGHTKPREYLRMLANWQLESEVLDRYDPFDDAWIELDTEVING